MERIHLVPCLDLQLEYQVRETSLLQRHCRVYEYGQVETEQTADSTARPWRTCGSLRLEHEVRKMEKPLIQELCGLSR